MTTPDKAVRPRPDWPAVRLAYLNGEGSLRTLAQHFGVPLRTLERRCSQDGWRRAVKLSGGVAAAVAAEVAAQQGQQIGLSAAEFLERSIAESVDWLDQIQRAKALLAADDITGLRDLINAWRTPVEQGRKPLGLDDDRPAFHLHYHGAGSLRPKPVIDAAHCPDP
jgi:hypothetical protein